MNVVVHISRGYLKSVASAAKRPGKAGRSGPISSGCQRLAMVVVCLPRLPTVLVKSPCKRLFMSNADGWSRAFNYAQSLVSFLCIKGTYYS